MIEGRVGSRRPKCGR